MHKSRKQRLLLLYLSLAANFAAEQVFSQITCVHIPPSGPNRIFVEFAQKHLAPFSLQNLRKTGRGGEQPAGNWKVLALLVDFPDYRWHTTSDSNFVNPDSLYSPRHFQDMLFSQSVYADLLSASSYTGSMRDFYLANSYGQFDLDGDVAGWLTVKNDMAYYLGNGSGLGSYPNNAQRLVEEAIALADSIVDFSRYDNDGDGTVEALLVVHAGPGAEFIASANPAASQNYLWSHFSGLQSMRVDNVRVTGYAMMPEDGAIGVFCHEFGHGLGLPDLYDGDGSSEGIGEWCLMGSGSWCHKSGDRLGTSPSHFSAWSRLRVGWAMELDFQDGETIRLLPSEISGDLLVLHNSSMPSSEYFLLENRQPIGFDAGLTRRQKDFDLPPPAGLMIYHVDEAGSPSFDKRRLVDVEEASPYFDGERYFEQLDKQRNAPNHVYLDRGNRGDNGDPFPGFASLNDDLRDFLWPRSRDRFDDFTVPSAQTNAGAPSSIVVDEIRLDSLDVLCRIQLHEPAAVSGPQPPLPENLELVAQPNPASGGFRLRGILPHGVSAATVRLFDVLGRELVLEEIRPAPDGRFEWTTGKLSALPAGTYFACVQGGATHAVMKITLLR